MTGVDLHCPTWTESQLGPLENVLHQPMIVKARIPTTRAKGTQIESAVAVGQAGVQGAPRAVWGECGILGL
jgi:hypothetical protein